MFCITNLNSALKLEYNTLFSLFFVEDSIAWWAQAWICFRCELLVHAYKIHCFWTHIQIPRENLIIMHYFPYFLQKPAIMISVSVKNRQVWITGGCK